MQTLNQVLLMGYVGQDIILSHSKGKTFARMSLATHETYKVKGQAQERTDWHQVVFFGKLAETTGRYLKKGDPIFVEGRLEHKTWKDDKGEIHYSTAVIANSVRFIASKSNKEVQDAPVKGDEKNAAKK